MSAKLNMMESKPETIGNFKRSFGPLDVSALYTGTAREGDDANRMTLTRWTSQKSGLKVHVIVHFDTPGPLCDMFAAVRTEITDDSGRPHTLEHLVFLGSEGYPYKGVLDQLANRAFGFGTNAWTATDTTAYTIETAGSEGFLNILPVFLDHVFHPTLKSSGFVTEVFHINGNAEESGVVMSEMQGIENQSSSLMTSRMQQALYPKTSGYRSETGGLMAALRKLDIDQIREYHASMYLPWNVCVFVNGRMDSNKLLDVINAKVEPRFEAHGQFHGPRGPLDFKRPFIDTDSALNHGAPMLQAGKKGIEVVDFPESDESVGEWWQTFDAGPYDDFLTTDALDILGDYLSDSPVSVLAKEFIEIDEPLCTSISFDSTSQLTNILTISASDVPVEYLNDFGSQIEQVLRKVANDGIDLTRIAMLIDRTELRTLNDLEKYPGETCQNDLLYDFLYGSDDASNLEAAFQDRKRLQTLREWQSHHWTDLLKRRLLEAPSLMTIGRPSKKLANKLEADSAVNTQRIKAKYGSDGLKRLQQNLEDAQKANDVPIPDSIISDFKVPSLDSIDWISVDTARAEPGWTGSSLQRHVDQDPTQLPYFVQFDSTPSNFITINIHLFAKNLVEELRQVLSLYINSFFSLPLLLADKTTITHEEAVKQLDTDAISYDVISGSSAPLSESLVVSIKAKKGNYEKMIELLRNHLFYSDFDINRLKATAQKSVQSLPSRKREGDYVASSVLGSMTTEPLKSSRSGTELLYLMENEPKVVEALQDKHRASRIQDSLVRLRRALTDPKRMRISVAGDIFDISQPKKAWATQFQPIATPSYEDLPLARHSLSELGRRPSEKVVVYSVPSMESSYAWHAAKGPDSFDHPDRPALQVVITAMNAMEGYLWTSLRGAGLAYGSDIYEQPESGLILFGIYRSPNSALAWAAAKQVVESLANGKTTFSQLTLESAKSGLAYKTASRISNSARASSASFNNQALKNLPQGYERQLLAAANAVSVEDCIEVVKKYLVPLFQPSSSIAAIASSASKAEEIAQALKKASFSVELRSMATDDSESDVSMSGSDSGESMSE